MLDDNAVTRPRRCDNREQCAADDDDDAAAAAVEPRAADAAGLPLVLRVSPTDGLVAVGSAVVQVRHIRKSYAVQRLLLGAWLI